MIRPLLPRGAEGSEIFTRYNKSFKKIHQRWFLCSDGGVLNVVA